MSENVIRSPHQNVAIIMPEDASERKRVPIGTGLLDYFPAACAYIARISLAGNEQHNPGEPLHWARGKSNDHWDCISRHGMQRGTFDVDVFPGTNERIRHTGKLAWRALAMLQEELEAAAGFDPLATDAGEAVKLPKKSEVPCDHIIYKHPDRDERCLRELGHAGPHVFARAGEVG